MPVRLRFVKFIVLYLSLLSCLIPHSEHLTEIIASSNDISMCNPSLKYSFLCTLLKVKTFFNYL